jgi:hypothetical protein
MSERSEEVDGQVAGASGGTAPIEGGPKFAPKSSAKVRAGRGKVLTPKQRQQKSRSAAALRAAAALAVGGNAVAAEAVDLASPACDTRRLARPYAPSCMYPELFHLFIERTTPLAPTKPNARKPARLAIMIIKTSL